MDRVYTGSGGTLRLADDGVLSGAGWDLTLPYGVDYDPAAALAASPVKIAEGVISAAAGYNYGLYVTADGALHFVGSSGILYPERFAFDRRIAEVFAEPDLYRRMERAAADPGFQTFRYYRAPENGAPYSYITMLKAWCLQDASERTAGDCMLAWVDFGFNHSCVTYAKPEDFDFRWEYEFAEKITAFCHQDPAEVSLIDTLQFMMPYFDGSVVVMPKALCAHYWEAVRGAMDAMVKLGCVDDDQMLLLITYKNEPDLFDIRLEKGWYSALALCSHQHFTLAAKAPASSDGKSARIMARLAQNPQHPFVRRVYEKLIRYYYPDENNGSTRSTT